MHPPGGNFNKRRSTHIKDTKTGKTTQPDNGVTIGRTSILSRWCQEAERVTPE